MKPQAELDNEKIRDMLIILIHLVQLRKIFLDA